MSRKIVSNIFNFAAQNGAQHLVISGQEGGISLDCHFSNGSSQALALPKKIEQDFFKSLQQILAIAPGDLLSRQYRKIADRNGKWKYYLSVLPDKQGEKIVISLINQDNKLWRLNQLGLQTRDRQGLKKISKWRSGLIIVSSPPRGGKSATLYSLLPLIDRPSLNIYALDNDPPTILPGINILSPNKSNWRKILQHDSDIIIADDLDEDWALENAISAAASGRLVLGTMTANSAQESLNKILQTKLPRRLKIDSLRLIINQRLTKLRPISRKNKLANRENIGLFEVLTLKPEIKSFITASDEKELNSPKFIKKLEQSLLLSGFRPLLDDEQQKIKDCLI